MSRSAVAPSTTSFRYESEMIPALRAALPRLAFGHRADDAVEVFSEVPAVHGIPDLVGLRFDRAAVDARRTAGILPLSGDSEVRAVSAIQQGATDSGSIATRIGMSRDYVRRAVLPLLSDLGWITYAGDVVAHRPEARWVGKRVVTVEAKLRDWRRALAQARRQQHSADAAYIALDSLSATSVLPYLTQIASAGIGVITVDPRTDRTRVLTRPVAPGRRATQVGRALLAERTLEMLTRGTHEGQIYPVFGWTVPLPE